MSRSSPLDEDAKVRDGNAGGNAIFLEARLREGDNIDDQR